MSQFIQLFRHSPESPTSTKSEGRFRRFRRKSSKPPINDLNSEPNFAKKRSVSVSALSQLQEDSSDEIFAENKRRNSVIITNIEKTERTERTDCETEPKNQISVKELIEKMITHLQVLERKNEILSQSIEQLSEEKSSLEADLSSTKIELNLYKSQLKHYESIAEEWHCSLCRDNKIKIISTKRRIVSTLCGHLFCSKCVQSLTSSSQQPKHCPTCRKPLPDGQPNYHPIYT